jgi:hypothetical protein
MRGTPYLIRVGERNVPRLASQLRGRSARRDAIDARIIDSQNEVGGYPHPSPTSRSVTVPDSVDARRTWLDELSSQLAVASSLNVPPL